MGFSGNFAVVLLAVAVSTWLVTFTASQGRHSPVHHRIARLALRLEVGLGVSGLFGLLGVGGPLWLVLSGVGLLAVGGCFLAVFLTDNYIPDAYRNVRHLLARGEWVGAGR